jgi:hypothetical protein
MTFNRIDDRDEFGNVKVSYVLSGSMYAFEIQATKTGVRLVGVTPYYTDWTPVQKYLAFAQYQSQKLRETGSAIPQHILEKGSV